MVNCRVVFVFLFVVFSLISYSVQAQLRENGYRGYQCSTGYMPEHTKQANRLVATTAEEAVAKFSPEEHQAVSVARPSQETWKTIRVSKTQRRSNVPAELEDTNLIEIDKVSMRHSPMSCEDRECCSSEEIDGCLASCCQPCYYWTRVEYLAWWKQGMQLPALVTTNPTAAPTLDDPNTVILFGDDAINEDAKSGGRYTIGMWLNPCRSQGIDFAYMHLGAETTSYSASGSNYSILGRPFFNIQTGAADVSLIDYPDTYSGWVNVAAQTKFQGTELLWRAVKRGPYSQIDFIGGWRWVQLKDDLLISESVMDTQSTTIALSDRFNTKNNFHGVELGFRWEQVVSCAWTLEVLGKLAIGNSHSVVTIAGESTSELQPNQGLLALNSNSGTYTRDSFAAITEIGLSVKRRFHCGLEASFGYTIVYWSDVMRAGDQIDLNVDPRQIPPDPQSATHPMALLNTTDFWAQGLQFGLEYAF